MTEQTWVTLPLDDQPLVSATYVSRGKRAGLILEFANGTTLRLFTAHVRINAGAGVELDIARHGETTVKIHGGDTGLLLHQTRIGFDHRSEQREAAIQERIKAWLESGGKRELYYDVDAELRLAAAAPHAQLRRDDA